jgi:hypothetical protein
MEPEARVLPSGEKATLRIAAVCAFKMYNGAPSSTRHSCSEPSSEPQARIFPSGEKATLRIDLGVVGFKMRISILSAIRHSHIVPFPNPEVKVVPSGEKAMLVTLLSCFSVHKQPLYLQAMSSQAQGCNPVLIINTLTIASTTPPITHHFIFYLLKTGPGSLACG